MIETKRLDDWVSGYQKEKVLCSVGILSWSTTVVWGNSERIRKRETEDDARVWGSGGG